jgi:hypothetical protein
MLRTCNDIIGRPAHFFLLALFAAKRQRRAERAAFGTSVSCRLGQWFASLCLLVLAFGVTPAQAAGPSVICPPTQSFIVASGAA